MKKIILGCTAILLSLGLLAGCDNEDDDEIIDPDPTIVDDDGPETHETYQVKLRVCWEDEEGEPCWYYFSGTEDNYNDIGTTTEWDESPYVTITTVSGGVTLSFTDDSNTERYLHCYESGVIVDLISEPFTWTWNSEYETFAAYDVLDKEDRLLGLDNADLDIRVYPISRGLDKFEIVQALIEKPE